MARVEEAFPPAQVASGGLRQLAQECSHIILCLPDCAIVQRVRDTSSPPSTLTRSLSLTQSHTAGPVWLFVFASRRARRLPQAWCGAHTHARAHTQGAHAHTCVCCVCVQGMCWWTAARRIRCGRRRQSGVCAAWA
jgi:hypothetical protein